jgi:VIT1/CCC1 family predicted Fe2+/Mn2+ transporter
MAEKAFTPEEMKNMLLLQQGELDGQLIYAKLAEIIKDPNNKKVLSRISGEERKHYQVWKVHTGQDVSQNKAKVAWYFWLARLLGLTFAIKLMERGEEETQEAYSHLLQRVPEARAMLKDEEQHEDELVAMIDEESLRYAGSVVLGLNDALVELTGALAGFSFAFQQPRLIALAGLITGISASFSMAASEYLSSKADGEGKDALKSALYTGAAYIFTVAMLVFPFLVSSNYLLALGWTLLNAVLIIAAFNYYISVAKDLNFKRRFVEMTTISLGVAAFSFAIGVAIRTWIGIDI